MKKERKNGKNTLLTNTRAFSLSPFISQYFAIDNHGSGRVSSISIKSSTSLEKFVQINFCFFIYFF